MNTNKKKQLAMILIILFAFIALVVFVIFANSNKEKEFGEVKEVPHVSLSEEGKVLELEKKDKKTKDGKHKIFNDFYGGYQFEYPSDYKRESKASNHIHLSKKNSFIQIEHTPIFQDEEMLEKIEGKRLMQLFEAKLASEKFEIDSKKYRRDSYQNPISDLKNGVKEASSNEYILGQDFTPLHVRNENNDIESDVVKERRYYLYNGKCATVISLVCLAEDFEEEAVELDNMMKSRTPISEKYSEVYEVKTNNATLNIPKFYSKKKATHLLGDGIIYACPPDSSSVLSGSFIQVLENKENYLKNNIEYFSPLDVYFELYEDSSGTLSQSNCYDFTKMVRDEYNPFAYFKEEGYEVNTYMTRITLLPTSEPESRILDAGATITMYATSLVKDGKETDIVIAGEMERTNEMVSIIKNMLK